MVKVSIPTKTLNDGGKMPLLGLGTWAGIKDGVVDREEMKKIKAALSYALEIGYKHIDTAALYRVEPEIGEAVQKAVQDKIVTREELFIVTKLWNDKHNPADVEPALKESLTKLKMDYVDLYLMHWPVAFDSKGNVQDIDYLDTWKAMEKLKAQGLAKSIGVSNFNIEQLKRLIDNSTVKPSVNQVELNLNLQQPDLVEYCNSVDITLTAYTPFGSLLGTRDVHSFFGTNEIDESLSSDQVKPSSVSDPQLVSIANKYNKSVTQILLKHLVQQGIVAIPKSATLSRILENASIFDFELSKEDLTALRGYDNGYRTVVPIFFQESPYYPFEKLDIKAVQPDELMHTL